MSQPRIETDSSFLSFLNPRIYLISILPALALFTPNQAGQGLRLVWATFSLVLLQHGVNLLNDLEDDRRGADDNKSDSWIRHFKNSAILQKHGLAFFFSGIFLGLLCLLHFQNLGVVLWSAPFVWAAWAYNKSDKPISYSRFSEWVTAACYGPGVVVSLALLCNQSLNLRTISLSLAFAALAAAVLLAHQIPQISDDQKVSKQSFALRHGARKSSQAIWILMAGFAFCLFFANSQGAQLLFLIATSAFLYGYRLIQQKSWNPGALLEFGTFAVSLNLLTQIIWKN